MTLIVTEQDPFFVARSVDPVALHTLADDLATVKEILELDGITIFAFVARHAREIDLPDVVVHTFMGVTVVVGDSETTGTTVGACD